jgi:hypothetical protein
MYFQEEEDIMIKDRIKEIADNVNAEHPYISLYLNVTPNHDYHKELNSVVHSTLHKIRAENRYSKHQIKDLETLVEKIQDYFRTRFQHSKRTRMLVLFANKKGMWEEIHLPAAIPSQATVEPHPYVRPVSMLLDKLERYGVLVCDMREARMFTLFLGEFEEHSDIFFEDYVPDTVHDKLSRTVSKGNGVHSGLGDQRILRHIEDHVHRHLKHVADQVFAMYKRNQFNTLLLGGPEDKTLPWLKDHLHSYIQKIVVGEFHTRPDRHIEEIKEKALEAVDRYEQQQEIDLINTLLEENYPGGKASLGLQETLNSLMIGQVHTLVVQDKYRKPGHVCPNDHYLSIENKPCPLCNGEMVATDDFIEEMVEEAIAQNAEIRHIYWNNDTFQSYGIGALLRFSLQ